MTKRHMDDRGERIVSVEAGDHMAFVRGWKSTFGCSLSV